MPLILIVLVILLLGGGGGWYVGGPDRGGVYSGGWVGIVLSVLLILYVTGRLGPIR